MRARPSCAPRLAFAGFLTLHLACAKGPEVDLLRSLDRWELQWPTTAIDASAPAGRRYFLDGWGGSSTVGPHTLRWAVAQPAQLKFQRRPQPLWLRLFGISPDDRPVEIEIKLNDHAIGRARFTPEGNPVALAIPATALAASGDQRLELSFAREIVVETPRPRGRPRRERRYFGLFYATLGARSHSADQLRRWERDAFRLSAGGLLAPSRSSLTSYWRPTSKTALEFELRHPAHTAARLGAQVRSWCDGHTNRWREQLSAGQSASGRIDLKSCAGRPTAIALEVEGPRFAGQALMWTRARLVEPPVEAAPEPPRPAPFARGTPVVLIVLDAAGAKHFGCYGYPRATTPHLDRLAKGAVLFERAYSPSAYTLPAVGSLLTGRYPDSHGIIDLPAKLPAAAITLAEVLRQGGYRTASLVGNHHAGSPFGYDQGFGRHRIWKISGRLRALRDERAYENYAENLVDAAIRLLADQTAGQPFFLYLHLREPHGPYAPPEPYRSQFASAPIGSLSGSRRELIALEEGTLSQPAALERMVALYDANLAYADAQVGRLLERLRRLGLYDSSWIIVTADHGESFLEHGTTRHSTTVYEENIHIPLLMKLPAGTAAPTRVPQLASLIDLMPTVLAGVGLATPEGVEGIDLRPFLYGEPAARERSLYAITVPQLDGAALIQARYKLIRIGAARPVELYDLSRDPEEARDLAAQRPLLAGLMRQELMTLRARYRARRSWKPATAVLDQETRQALRALGYAN